MDFFLIIETKHNIFSFTVAKSLFSCVDSWADAASDLQVDSIKSFNSYRELLTESILPQNKFKTTLFVPITTAITN